MAGLYLVGAWLIAQVAETILPAFEVPNWVMRAIVIVLALGFLPAVIFAWVFELTPGGIKRDEDVAPGQSIAPSSGAGPAVDAMGRRGRAHAEGLEQHAQRGAQPFFDHRVVERHGQHLLDRHPGLDGPGHQVGKMLV